MKVTIERTKIVKPFCDSNNLPVDPKSHFVPLSVFDKVSYNTHVAIIYAYNPPTPTNATIELGLQKVLSEYREWAGRLGEDENGDPVIFLNDKGVNFVEASIDIKLEQVMPLQPSPFLLSLHPKVKDVEALLQVQLTRFACGSLVIGFTGHHLVADGHSASNFLVAWGKATRGLDINPLPLHDRTIFNPRNPPYFEFEHKGKKLKSIKSILQCSVNGRARMNPKVPNEYFGNLVLWTYPSSKVEDLVQEPLGYAAKLVRNAVESVNDKYFKSFIDFATVKAKEEDLVPTADANVSTCIPNLKVDSWLRFPFYELDFGGGSPCIFMPSYIPIEGFMFLLPSCNGDGSADACITLFRKNMDIFKQIVSKLLES
ncbi:hypothetical protein JCGZ_11223 [Jatropha curcas]|uniref:Agmatine coumaroyltransferase-2-like n=1 Tax=Jatropha curcas TaxID=180498 RepID=A0A067KPX3_JATCU|nr:hypothetical protein JCGZ_11223 [Jatropha curcas]